MRPSIVVAALILVVLGAYANALDVPFLWDDRPLILVNPDVQHGASLGHYFSQPFWPDPDEARAFFRPAVAISYRIDFLLHGENAAGFHLVNIAFHLLNTGILYALLRRWESTTYASALACGAFALLPRLTEAVTWIAGRTDVLATTGVLGALLVWPDDRSERRFLRACLAATALLLGLLCKEVALAGLVALVTFELVQKTNRSPRQRAALLAPPIALTAFFVVLHEHVLGSSSTGDGLQGIGSRLAAAGATWGTYAGMLLAPWRPLLQVGLIDVAPPLAIAAGVIVMAVAAGVLAKTVMRREATMAAGLAMTVTGIALVSHLVAIPTSVLCCDRFLYLPAAGLAVIGGVAAGRLSMGLGRVAAGISTIWILTCAIATFTRNAHMADELGLWIETAERAEIANPMPAVELGNVLFRAGDSSEALRLQTAALRKLDRDGKTGGSAWVHAAGTTATCLSSLGDYEQARLVRGRLVSLQPTSWRAWLDLARVELHELDFDASRATVLRAEQIADEASVDAGQLLTLIEELERTHRALGPTGAASLEDLARFEDRAGRRVQAERAWSELLRTSNVAPAIVGEGAAFLARRGSLDAASLAAARVLAEPSLAAEAAEIRDVVDDRRRVDQRIGAVRERVRAYETRMQ